LKGYFLIILIFVLAFGIALQAILQPSDNFTLKIFIDVFDMAYWQIFGDSSVLDKMRCVDGRENCTVSNISSFILMMIYMMIANVLLINLLIAMFRYTFRSNKD
jgi:hypothetical protein